MLTAIPDLLLESRFNGKIIDTKSGHSGRVYIVDHGENVHPRKVAYKSFKLTEEFTDEQKGFFIDECALWFAIKNPYIIVPFYAEIISGVPFLCMPCCDGDLKSIMKGPKLEEVSALVLSCRLIKAVIEMRKSGIIQHQDLNPPNVLVQDLTVNFPDHPKDFMLNFDLKISDFGIANLREKLGPTMGGAGGKFPFKAPEQYEVHRYENYEPDVFALGVMIYMLLNGKHPNGLINEIALKSSTRSSHFKKWINAGTEIELENQAIANVLNQALNKDPSKRVKPEDMLTVFMAELHAKSDYAYQYLAHRFGYQDATHQYEARKSSLHNLFSTAALPGRREDILEQFVALLKEQLANIDDPAAAIYYGQILNYAASLLKKTDGARREIIEHAENLLRLLPLYGTDMTASLQYPSFTYEGLPVMNTPKIRDYEVAATYASLAISILDKFSDPDETRSIFEVANAPLMWSLYYYHYASQLRHKEIEKSINYLERAKAYCPQEGVFDYMMNLWIGNYVVLAEIENQPLERITEYKERAEKAIKSARALAPGWYD
jgi:serine/threonine protein kinase